MLNVIGFWLLMSVNLICCKSAIYDRPFSLYSCESCMSTCACVMDHMYIIGTYECVNLPIISGKLMLLCPFCCPVLIQSSRIYGTVVCFSFINLRGVWCKCMVHISCLPYKLAVSEWNTFHSLRFFVLFLDLRCGIYFGITF